MTHPALPSSYVGAKTLEVIIESKKFFPLQTGKSPDPLGGWTPPRRFFFPRHQSPNSRSLTPLQLPVLDTKMSPYDGAGAQNRNGLEFFRSYELLDNLAWIRLDHTNF
jgi:hypothetical protein